MIFTVEEENVTLAADKGLKFNEFRKQMSSVGHVILHT